MPKLGLKKGGLVGLPGYPLFQLYAGCPGTVLDRLQLLEIGVAVSDGLGGTRAEREGNIIRSRSRRGDIAHAETWIEKRRVGRIARIPAVSVVRGLPGDGAGQAAAVVQTKLAKPL